MLALVMIGHLFFTFQEHGREGMLSQVLSGSQFGLLPYGDQAASVPQSLCDTTLIHLAIRICTAVVSMAVALGEACAASSRLTP